MTKGPELNKSIQTFLNNRPSEEARKIATELKELVDTITKVTSENFSDLVMSHEMTGAVAEQLQDLAARVKQLKKSEAKKLQPLVEIAFGLRKAVFDAHVDSARLKYASVN